MSTTASITTSTPVRRGALLLVGLLLVAANLRASITPVGPVLGDIRDSLGLSALTASVLVSIPLVAFAVISPAAPWLTRRLGIERSLGAALGLLAVAIVIRSLPALPALWAGTALLGIAIAIMNVTLPTLVKRDYPDRIGQLTGAYSATQSMLAAIAAGVAVPLAGVAQEGWRLSLGIWAGLAIVALAVFAPQLRRRSIPAPRQAETPATRERSPWRSMLAWQVTLFMGLQSTVFYVLITWLPSIEQAAGIPAATAGLHQFLFNALSIAGNLACAAAVHRLRDQRPIAITLTAFVAIAVGGVLLAPQFAIVWVCFGGIGAGAGIVLALSMFGLRSASHQGAASLSGMAQSFGYLMAAAGPIGIGLLHDLTGQWSAALFALLGLLVAQLIFGTLAARDRVMR